MGIAEITLKQLGGAGRLKAFAGGRDFMSDGVNGEILMFKFKGKVANYVEIALDAASDTYVLKFKKVGRMSRKTFKAPKVVLVEEVAGVYCDNLVEVFERVSGLYLSL